MSIVKTWLYDKNDNKVSPKVTWDQILLDDEVSSFKDKYTEEMAAAGATITDGSISSAKIGQKEVKTANIDDKAVTTAKINDNAVSESKIADEAVTEDKIKDGAITKAKLASNISFDASSLGDGAITEAKLGANSVSTGKLQTDAVHTINIFAGAVTSAKIGEGEVKTTNINGKAVTSAKIGDGEVKTVNIADDAVTADKLADSINTDIANGLVTHCVYNEVENINISDNTLKDKLLSSKANYLNINLTTSGTYDLDIDCINASVISITGSSKNCLLKLYGCVSNSTRLVFNTLTVNVDSAEFENCYLSMKSVDIAGLFTLNNSFVYADNCGFASFNARGSSIYLTGGASFTDPVGEAAANLYNSTLTIVGSPTATLATNASVPFIKSFGSVINISGNVSAPRGKYSKGYDCSYSLLMIPGSALTALEGAGAAESSLSYTNNLAVSNVTADTIGYTHTGLDATNVADAIAELYSEISNKEVTDGSITSAKLSSDFTLPTTKLTGTIEADSLKSSASVPIGQVSGNIPTSRLEGTITADAVSADCTLPTGQLSGSIEADSLAPTCNVPVAQIDGDILADGLAEGVTISTSQINGTITADALSSECTVSVSQLDGDIVADSISATCTLPTSQLSGTIAAANLDKQDVIDDTALDNLLTALGTATGYTFTKQWTGTTYTFTATKAASSGTSA